jgi:hypothetical protein
VLVKSEAESRCQISKLLSSIERKPGVSKELS